jgi:hypothetical protein
VPSSPVAVCPSMPCGAPRGRRGGLEGRRAGGAEGARRRAPTRPPGRARPAAGACLLGRARVGWLKQRPAAPPRPYLPRGGPHLFKPRPHVVYRLEQNPQAAGRRHGVGPHAGGLQHNCGHGGARQQRRLGAARGRPQAARGLGGICPSGAPSPEPSPRGARPRLNPKNWARAAARCSGAPRSHGRRCRWRPAAPLSAAQSASRKSPSD